MADYYTLSDVAKMGPPAPSLEDVKAMQAKAAPAYDPSAGEGTLRFAVWDTGIPTPQWLNRGLAGAGKAVSDLGNGMRQIGAMAGIGDADKVQADIDEAKRLDAPLMNTGAGLAGNVAGNVAMTLLPAGAVARGATALNAARTANVARAFIAPTSYLGAAGAGATLGAIQPVASDDSRAFNTAAGTVGGVLGQGVVNGLGRIAQPVKNALDPIRQKAVDTLRNAGVPLDLAQLTGSPVLGRIRSSLTDNLFTLGGQQAKAQAQKEAFTKAALSTIGENADAATSDVMGAADKRINGVFRDVLDNNNVKVTSKDLAPDGWISRLTDAQSKAIEGDHPQVAGAVKRLFDAIDPETGEISGQVAYGIKKDLQRYANTADSNQKFVALSARSALMDGINDSLSGADQQAFAQARGQFANMKKLERAISTDGTGEISAAKLANIFGQNKNLPASVYGKGPQELVSLAQSGKQVLADPTPNSGTAARAFAALAPGAIVGVGTQLATGDPLEALKYGASVAAIPKTAQFLLNNPRVVKALSNGVTQPTVRGLLESPQKSVLAGQLARTLPLLGARASLLPATEE